MMHQYSLLLCLIFSLNASASTELCEKIDGDCPDDCSAAGFEGTENFNALFKISPSHPSTMRSAWTAERYIRSSGSVSSTDNPLLGLHTSVYYFCCYTKSEKAAIILWSEQVGGKSI